MPLEEGNKQAVLRFHPLAKRIKPAAGANVNKSPESFFQIFFERVDRNSILRHRVAMANSHLVVLE